MKRRISVVIADDHRLIRESLFDLLKKEYDANVSLASTSQEVIALLRANETDILFLDFPMPHGDGFRVIENVRRLAVDTRIIILTDFQEEPLIRSLLKLGVHGILLKKVANQLEICRAIESVLAHKPYYNQKVKCTMLDKFNDVQLPQLLLSDREYEIIELLSHGNQTKQIAALLSLSEHTVEGYRKNLLRKTQTRNCVELIAFFMRNGIIQANIET